MRQLVGILLLALVSTGCEMPATSSVKHLSISSVANTNSVTISPALAPSFNPNYFQKRYIYFGGNFTQSKLTADATFSLLSNLISRAGPAGYNGIVLCAGGSGSFENMVVGTSSNYYTNFAAIVAQASAAGIELIPCGARPTGVKVLNPSLVEAFPVNNTPFLVSGSVANPVGAQIFTNTSFESALNPSLYGTNSWYLMDGTSNSTGISLDTTVAHTGSNSVKFNQSGAVNQMARLYTKLTGITPHKAYRLSFWVKTDSNYTTTIPLKVLILNPLPPYGALANYGNPVGWGTTAGAWNAVAQSVSSGQNWTQYNLDFNTANYTSIAFYFGLWGGTASSSVGGNVWIDDINLTEVGLAHAVQRSTLPYSVTSLDGATTYTAGTDYTLGTEQLIIPPGSKIANGSTVNVSWYQTTEHITDAANANACSQEYFDLMNNVVQLTDNLMNHPKGYFMYYDEWRSMNWDPSCGPISAGTYLANTVQKQQSGILAVNPGYEMYIWNDMFDPYQNAVNNYWTVNGDLTGSWNGLHPNTIIMNWNVITANQVNSLQFFSNKGFKQMLALYYDDPTFASTDAWMNNLGTAVSSGVTGVEGFMYTTWNNDYSNLEAVAQRIKSKYPQYWP